MPLSPTPPPAVPRHAPRLDIVRQVLSRYQRAGALPRPARKADRPPAEPRVTGNG